jgi:hypothetical protein
VRRTGIEALVNLVGSGLVAPEADHAELGLDHARLDLGHADRRVDELLHHGLGERLERVLGRAVDRAANVRLAARDGAERDDMPALARLELCAGRA